jgi:hypothetical protein
MKKLSICIPTFNRSKHVLEQLDFLREEIIGFEDSVQIIVSDNCSNQSEVVKVKSYHNNNKFFQLFFQEVNLGLIGNTVFLLNNSISEFIWFVGDDDKLDSGILSLLFEIFNNYDDISYIFFNHDCFKNDISNVVDTFNLSEFSGYHKTFGDNMLKILDYYGAINMFMTSNIYKRDVLLDGYRKFNRKPQIDDFLLFSFICSSESATFIVDDVYVHDNYAESTWSNNARKIFSSSVPQRIIDIEKLQLDKNNVKKTLFSFYYKGRGNFLYMMLNSPVKLTYKIFKFLGLSYCLRLFLRSFFINILRLTKSIKK